MDKILINDNLYYHIIEYNNTTFKVKKTKKCWYCDSSCKTFVSICKNCYNDRKKSLKIVI